ncbi:MAG: ABC transporter permease subunit [Treponema sp.]|nr:ABC transporter permease subunit [Treponema sp.]
MNLSKRDRLKKIWLYDKWLYILLLPGLLYYVLFKLLPIWGLAIAFQNYQPFLGLWKSKWVGFANFQSLFADPIFFRLLRNTLVFAVINIVFFFPLPIILALLLNELKNQVYKKTVQTIIYIPHFFSWIIVAGITYVLFTTEGGAVNNVIFSLSGSKVNFLSDVHLLRPLILGQTIWKEGGWGTIIFLAALTGIDPNLYEAASIDGANRFHKLWNISLPAIAPTIAILLILRMGSFLDVGFEQLFVMINAGNRDVGEVFDTYVYNVGITQGRFSFTTAVGMFKSVVACIMVVSANWWAKKAGQSGIL